MLNVLVAEDNRADIYLIQQALEEERLAFQLCVVEDGEQAMRHIGTIGHPGHAPCPDIVLLDLNLPKKSGGEILKSLRGNPHCADTPVVVMSSSDAPADPLMARELGAEYFRKPSSLNEFLRLGSVVRRLCSS